MLRTVRQTELSNFSAVRVAGGRTGSRRRNRPSWEFWTSSSIPRRRFRNWAWTIVQAFRIFAPELISLVPPTWEACLPVLRTGGEPCPMAGEHRGSFTMEATWISAYRVNIVRMSIALD